MRAGADGLAYDEMPGPTFESRRARLNQTSE
jgi:hypothetical protein